MSYSRIALILALGALGLPGYACAQGQYGETTLRKGLAGRVVELGSAEGIQPSRDEQGRIKAGYYRLRFTGVGLTNVGQCPRSQFPSNSEFKKWRSAESGLYNKVFSSKGLWSITASMTLLKDNIERTPREIRLIRVENPEEKSCNVVVAGSQAGDAAAMESLSFPIPISSENKVYSQSLNVVLRSAYHLDPDKNRIDQVWKGLNLFATAVSAGLGPIVGAVTPNGKTETIKALTENVETAVPILFDGVPASGSRGNKVFVYLGFPPLPTTPPTAIQGGYVIALDYQATLYREGQFFDPVHPITSDEVLAATPIPGAGGGGSGLRTISAALDTNMLQTLLKAADVSAFDSACLVARPALRQLDLSDVDADLYLWAMARQSPQPGVSGNIDKLTCFGSVARANLARAGVTIEDRVPQISVANLKDMHDAMTMLGFIAQSPVPASGESYPSAVLDPFAEQIKIVVADDATRAWVGLPGVVQNLSRQDALKLLASKFSRIGCYAPRAGRDDLMLPLRPEFAPLPANGRASAALILSDEDKPRPYIASLGFDPVPKGSRAKISIIQISQRGLDADAVTKELTENRRPVSCSESWMDEAFVGVSQSGSQGGALRAGR
ncbi:hypothetical protein [Sphingobium sp. EM0848]|uniref:hypothetical protein n=1 Tax=Sphingobium sp. EM0848 TaxID=2743473 RepID=UPI00159C1036|nr:hypothetical protein [Sphingobium sp. EM0848]